MQVYTVVGKQKEQTKNGTGNDAFYVELEMELTKWN